MQSHAICKMLFSLLLLTGLARLAAQDDAAGVVIGKKLKLFSKVLNEERTAIVGKPNSYEQEDER